MKQTMKHQSLLSGIKSLGIMLSLGLALASCTKDDVAQNPAKPNEEGNKNLTTFVAGGENKTRTSMDYNSGNFSWEAGDYIYVIDDNGVWQKSTNAPTSKVASFNYTVPGKFTDHSSYMVLYLGESGDSYRPVIISQYQSQTSPNNTEHFSESGDYGTATATKVTGKNQFEFVLEHSLAYLVFQPYTTNPILQNCRLTRIDVISNNDIAGVYNLNEETGALGAAKEKFSQITLNTSGTTSGSGYDNGFPLTNNRPSVTTNGAYMSIKPGVHTLKVRYWVKDTVTNVEGAITKTYPSTRYASNTYYDMTAQLDVKDYDGDHYYMWDAQRQYWYGYEWTKNLGAGVGQPTVDNQLSDNYAKNNSDSRWYHEGIGAFQATQSCDTLPNANELSWYCMYGDPRWDEDEIWTTMGHLYKGGMWFKKKSVLQAERHYDTEKSANGKTDLRVAWEYYHNSDINRIHKSGRPSAADANKYFFLPVTGKYNSAQLVDISYIGEYWSSSGSFDQDDHVAYYLTFNPWSVEINTELCKNGLRIGWFK